MHTATFKRRRRGCHSVRVALGLSGVVSRSGPSLQCVYHDNHANRSLHHTRSALSSRHKVSHKATMEQPHEESALAATKKPFKRVKLEDFYEDFDTGKEIAAAERELARIKQKHRELERLRDDLRDPTVASSSGIQRLRDRMRWNEVAGLCCESCLLWCSRETI